MDKPRDPTFKADILFVVAGTEDYGVQRMTVSTIRALRCLGVQCKVVGLGAGGMLDSCRDAGANAQSLHLSEPPNYTRSFRDNVRSALALRAYSRHAAKPLADVIHDSGSPPVIVRMPNLVPLVAKAAYMARTQSYWILPNAVSSRYPLSANKLIYEYIFLRFGMTPIANSYYTKGTLLNWLSDAKVLHLGIDSDEFRKNSVPYELDRLSFGFATSDIVIGIFARLVPEKGQERLIHAIATLGDAYKGVKLVVAGAGDPTYEGKLRQLVAANNLEHRVKFVGEIADLRPYYVLCDIIANCRVDAEPFGLSIIEAMMMGRPVLAHRLGGPSETIVDGVTGWLMPDASVETITNVLRIAIADRKRWPEIGLAGRKHAMQHFQSTKVAENLIAIISSELKKKSLEKA